MSKNIELTSIKRTFEVLFMSIISLVKFHYKPVITIFYVPFWSIVIQIMSIKCTYHVQNGFSMDITVCWKWNSNGLNWISYRHKGIYNGHLQYAWGTPIRRPLDTLLFTSNTQLSISISYLTGRELVHYLGIWVIGESLGFVECRSSSTYLVPDRESFFSHVCRTYMRRLAQKYLQNSVWAYRPLEIRN